MLAQPRIIAPSTEMQWRSTPELRAILGANGVTLQGAIKEFTRQEFAEHLASTPDGTLAVVTKSNAGYPYASFAQIISVALAPEWHGDTIVRWVSPINGTQWFAYLYDDEGAKYLSVGYFPADYKPTCENLGSDQRLVIIR